MTGEQEVRDAWLVRLRLGLRELYHGQSERAVRFRFGVIAIDLVIVGFFIAAPFLRDSVAFLYIDYLIAALMAADIGARMLAWRRFWAGFRSPLLWLDLFVLMTLLAPQWLFNLGFLRVLRLLTLVHSEFFWNTVGRRFDDTRWEDVTRAATTLLTFVFVMTGFVYTSFVGQHAHIGGYVDALYFTMSTLTTTGFGDIVLPGTWGKLLSILIMVLGISLFVRLAQALVKPYKVRFPCPTCGLSRHDPDAVHCKACGTLINIPNEE